MKRKLLWTALILLVLPVIVALLYGVVKSAMRGDQIVRLFIGIVLYASAVSGVIIALANLPDATLTDEFWSVCPTDVEHPQNMERYAPRGGM
jgi:hypothetical protein